MKQTSWALLSVATLISLVATPAFAVTINRNINAPAIEEVQEETFDERQELTLEALETIEEVLVNVEAELQDAEYASDDTKEDGQAAIDGAQAELNAIQEDVTNAENTQDLVSARQDAIAWAQENKDVAKELMVDIYIDGLNFTVAQNEQIINSAESLVVYFKKYQIDTATLQALITQANGELTTAQNDVNAAESQRTQASLETATRSTAALTETTTKIIVEVEELNTQLQAQ